MKAKKDARQLWRLIKENISFLVVIIATLVALALIVALTFGSFYTTARDNAVTIGNMTVSQEAQRIEDALFPGINTLLLSSYTVDSMLKRDADIEEIEDYVVQGNAGRDHRHRP